MKSLPSRARCARTCRRPSGERRATVSPAGDRIPSSWMLIVGYPNLDVTSSGAFFCFEQCSVDADCPTTFLCQPLSVGGAVCLPGPAGP